MSLAEKIRVAVNGYGVIGKRVADAVARQDDTGTAQWSSRRIRTTTRCSPTNRTFPGSTITTVFHTAPFLYVFDKRKFCWASVGPAGVSLRRRARSTS